MQGGITFIQLKCQHLFLSLHFIRFFQRFLVNLYKEYTSLKLRELEKLLRFQVMSWQPS